MKKLVILSAALLALTACSGNKPTAQNDSRAKDSTIYEGLVPAADAFGINYRMALANDGTKGFALDEAYMKDSLTADTILHYEGTAADTTVKGKKYCVLKVKGSDTYRFKIVNDSTLRLVGSDFEEAASGLPYDLKLKK